MRDKRIILGVWAVLLAICILIITRTEFRTDMAAFLPRSAPMAQQALTDQATDGAASHLLLLGITGASASAMAALSEALAAQLRRQPEFTDVLNGDDESFAGVRDFVWRNRYLLNADVTPARFSAAGLHAALVNDVGLLGSDLGMAVEQSLPDDPTGEIFALQPQLDDGQGPASENGVWFAGDGSRALLLVHTAAAGFDLDGQALALALIDADFSIARNTVPGARTARLFASGPGVFGIHTRDTTEHDVKRLSILASLGAIGLLAFAYRSLPVLLLGLLPVVSGALAAIAAVSLSFGFVHGITLGFGVTLIGESLDYAIYLFTQTGRSEDARVTLARIWPTLLLGALTSVVGFSAMLFSDFTGFAQLGLFSIVGLLAAAAVTRFVLPQLMPANFFAAGAQSISWPLRKLIAHRGRLRWLVVFAVAFSVAVLVTRHGRLWDDNLADMSPIPAADQALDQTLRQDLGVPDVRFFAVFKAPDRQAALRQSEVLAGVLNRQVAAQNLSGFDVPSAILPSMQAQRERQAALPDAATLQARLAAAGTGLPFRPGSFAPFIRDAAAARSAPLITPATLPPALSLRLATLLAPSGQGWVVMAPLRDVTDPSAVASALTTAGLPGLAFVDLNRESGQLLRRFQNEATDLAVFGSLAILLLLLAGLRSPRRVIVIAAPLACAVVITAGVLSLGGSKISIFMVVGFLLIVAVGSNYCLFFERLAGGEEMRRSIASIMLANLCTVSAYGLMSWSSIPVLHDIGRTVALGTFLAMVCAAILTPRIAAV